MARELEYAVPPVGVPMGFKPTLQRGEHVTRPDTFVDGKSSLEAAAKLLLSLHESGTLRALTGFTSKLGQISGVAMTAINTDAGRNALGSLLFLAEVMSKIPSPELTRVARGLDRGRERVRHSTRRKPRSTLGLGRLLMEEDTRRAIEVLLLMLNSIGAELGRKR